MIKNNKNTGWNRFVFIGSYVLLILGFMALIFSVLHGVNSEVHDPGNYLISLFLIIVGLGGLFYVKSSYMGGAPTLVGAILVIFGIFIIASVILYPSLRHDGQIYYAVFYIIIFFVLGCALLISGHNFHSLRKKNQDYSERK